MESTIKYVLKQYQEGRLDPGKAVSEFRRRHHSSPAGRAAVWSLSLAASLLLGLFLFNNWRNAWTEYGTPDGKSMAVLADGTRVTLSPGAVLKMQRHRNPRLVSLEGLAYFEVARDEAHPFEIVTDGAYVKVLGTKFSLDADRKQVRVESGKVLFAAAPNAPALVLTGRMQARVEDGTAVLSGEECLNPAAWATGRFVYENAPLAGVLAELGEYYGVVLGTGDTSVEGLRLNGVFSTDNLQTILSVIGDALEVQIEVTE